MQILLFDKLPILAVSNLLLQFSFFSTLFNIPQMIQDLPPIWAQEKSQMKMIQKMGNPGSDAESAIADPKRRSSRNTPVNAENSTGEGSDAGEKGRVKFSSLRALPRKFGISFAIPDRIAAEIGDEKKVRGPHPLRIQRVVDGGAVEFCRMVEEAERESPAWTSRNRGKKVSGRRFYHRARLNDWHPLVFYQIRSLQDIEEPPFLSAV